MVPSLKKKLFVAFLVPMALWVTSVLFLYPLNWMEPVGVAYVEVDGFDCPDDSPIKATVSSGIYHEPGDRYYARTSAENARCYQDARSAERDGFRPPVNP